MDVVIPDVPFVEFPKVPRLSRTVTVTEKIDGTNAQVFITDAGTVHAGSRTKWIVPGKQTDNFGFAAWVQANAEELLKLGPGSHFGEWYGAGIQRRYGLTEKRFALFNVERWRDPAARPPCCSVVPVIFEGEYDEMPLAEILATLRECGSYAVPGFANPEGIVIYHHAARQLFKKLLEHDEIPKGVRHSDRAVITEVAQ